MNLSVFNFLNSLVGRAVWLDNLIIFLADYLIWVMLAWVLFYFLYYRRAEIWLLLIPLVAWLASEVLQRLTAWPRPFVYLENVNQLVEHVPTGSFPSGHTTFFFAFALVTYTFSRTWGHWYTLTALLIGLARVVAGVHWPSDILGGFAFAALVVSIFFFFRNLTRPVRQL